jgi:hypothetical protein
LFHRKLNNPHDENGYYQIKNKAYELLRGTGHEILLAIIFAPAGAGV